MALSSFLSHPHISIQIIENIPPRVLPITLLLCEAIFAMCYNWNGMCCKMNTSRFENYQGSLVLKLSSDRKSTVSCGLRSQLFGQHIHGVGPNQITGWTFQGGCRIAARPNTDWFCTQKKRSAIVSSWIVGSQLASSAFTLGTLTVLPFYSLMVFAPKSEITKKAMGSIIPYFVLGLVYAYLLYRSWTPDTIRLIFASKYWLPELSSIAKLFSSEMTLASAWIHLLVVDLFVARHVYHDGLKNVVETRHSVALCLLSCPVGIMIHAITKALTRTGV